MGDLLPPEIARIINENRYEDPTDWFCKKFFAKPIAVETERKVTKSAAKDKEKDKEREAQRLQYEKEYKEHKLLEKEQKQKDADTAGNDNKSPTKDAPSNQLSLKEQHMMQLNAIVGSAVEKMLEI